MRVERRTRKFGDLMSLAEHYRKLAAELRAKARTEQRPAMARDLEHFAKCYVRLAEQADRNQAVDITYEPKAPGLQPED